MAGSPKDLETLKHKLSLQLEATKWRYRQAELQYLEAGQHLRALNQLMWQVPGMAIAITGGLWYGASTVEAESAKAWVLGFVALVNVLTAFVLRRLRHLIGIQIELQRDFAGLPKEEPAGARTVVWCWTVALVSAAVVSGIGACNTAALSKAKVVPPVQRCEVEIVVSTPVASAPLAAVKAPQRRKAGPVRCQ